MEQRKVSREELADLYLNKGLSQRQIGEQFDVATRTVGKWLRTDGIQARPRGAPLGCNTGARKAPIIREDLERMYVAEGKTQAEIAEMYGISEWAIGKRLRAFGIGSRPRNWVREEPRKQQFTEQDLRQLYSVERRSMKEIGERYGMNPISVAKWLRRYEIPIETPWERRAVKLDPAELRKLYEQDGWTLKQIAQHFGCSLWTVRWNFRRNEIPIATAEIRRQKATIELSKTSTTSDHKGYPTVRQYSDATNFEVVLEHRAAVEAAMGRALEACEIVHHLNMDKRDPRVENLAVLPNNVVHARVHKYMERIAVYLCGLGLIRPEPLGFDTEIFWAGRWIKRIDLLANAQVQAPLNALDFLGHEEIFESTVVTVN